MSNATAHNKVEKEWSCQLCTFLNKGDGDVCSMCNHKQSVPDKMKDKCDDCGAMNETRLCSGCKKVSYCNKQCQKRHWRKVHKKECKKMRKNQPHRDKENNVNEENLWNLLEQQLDGNNEENEQKEEDVVERKQNENNQEEKVDIDDVEDRDYDNNNDDASDNDDVNGMVVNTDDGSGKINKKNIMEHKEIEPKDRSSEEFERFLMLSIPNKTNATKYLAKFVEIGYNDIRYIEEFDGDTLENEIKMKKLDIKIFEKKIKKYKEEKQIFKQCFIELNPNDIYYEMFENIGILTLAAFHLHIKSVNDIYTIINNRDHSVILWKHLNDKINYKQQINDEENQLEGQ